MTKKTIVPLADHVVITVGSSTVSAAGILIPENREKEQPSTGQVVAVGKGRRSDAGVYVPLEVQKGDEVVFASYAAEKVTIEGVLYYIVREDQIMAVIT